jgi:hybrid cluster-associated redox disulfide protein
MNDLIPQPHHTVSEVMRRWPQTMSLFLQYGTACPGCPVGTFHTVEEAAREYQIPLRAFLSELRGSASKRDKRPVAKRKPRSAKGRRRLQQ